MRKDLISILCMTLLCATVMLGVMGIYRMIGTPTAQRSGKMTEIGCKTAFPGRISSVTDAAFL